MACRLLAVVSVVMVDMSDAASAEQSSQPAPLKGPYKTKCTSFYNVKEMDSSDRTIDACWAVPPANGNTTTFPLIVYGHGLFGGSIGEPVAYYNIFNELASWGYYVVGTRACNIGCSDKPVSLPGDPSGFGTYYEQLLKLITWSRDSHTSGQADFDHLDTSVGVGMCGHSMGGQGALFASSYDNATNYGIKATVLHHAYTHVYPPSSVPFLAFTGGKDTTAPPDMAHEIFNAPRTATVKGLVNKKSADHTEPCTDENKWLAQFTAAWFMLYVDGTPEAHGVNFHDLIFGKGSSSLCGGGDGDDLTECKVVTAEMVNAKSSGVVTPAYV